MAKIIVDYREDKKIVKELYKQKIDVEVKSLISADFVMQIKDIDGHVKDLAIERKTIGDFLNSIIDKRILTQLIALKENFPLQLLIIEGEENIYRIRNFHPNSIRGMLSSIAIDYQIPILYTKNYRDTAAYLALIARRLEKPKRHISLVSKRKPLTLKEQQEYLIESLPGIGPSLSKSLLKKFKSVKNVINAKEDKLQKVEKIGEKKSKLIREVLDSDYKD
ncbi:MAG: ERCC4 domain-containing protein [Nanoarchaeota archaeon]